MSTEENKAVVQRLYEVLNKGKQAGMAAIDELVAPDCVLHGTGVRPDMDLAGLKQLLTASWTAFPDARATVEDVIGEGDKVVARVTMRGTHRGDFMGVPPTEKQVSWTWIEIDRIKDGKLVEGWWNEDDLGLMQQLGAIPQMTQGGA